MCIRDRHYIGMCAVVNPIGKSAVCGRKNINAGNFHRGFSLRFPDYSPTFVMQSPYLAIQLERKEGNFVSQFFSDRLDKCAEPFIIQRCIFRIRIGTPLIP